MNQITNHIISDNCTIIDAITQISKISEDTSMTLFVLNKEGKPIGTITDGDVRRALIKGRQLSDAITGAMKKDFTSVCENKIDTLLLNKVKKQGITLVPVLNDTGEIVKIINLVHNKAYLPLDAVLMAGGKGERLRPLTLETPKPLLKVGAKAIIDYNVDNLLQNGVENISVTTNYLAHLVEEHFEAPRNNVQIKCVREPKFLGTIGSIRFIKKWHNDYILIMNSDLFTNIDLEDYFNHFIEHDAEMSVAAVPYSVNVPYGIFEIENKRDITGVREKPSYHYYANAGIYLIKKSAMDFIPEGNYFDATDLIQTLVDNGKSVIRYPLSGYWIDIGKPEDFNKVQDLANHLTK